MEVTCRVCEDLITEPLCEKCFGREIYIWAKEQPLPYWRRIKIVKSIVRMLKRLNLFEKSEILCIVCYNNTKNICTRCIIRDANILLKSEIKSRKSIDNMKEVFNPLIYEYGLKRS